jgi:hypothetical protein
LLEVDDRECTVPGALVLEAADEREQRLRRLGRPGERVPRAAVEET